MQNRSFHDGREDGLIPLESIALDEVDSFAELLRAMSHSAFAGRQLGEAFDILFQNLAVRRFDLRVSLDDDRNVFDLNYTAVGVYVRLKI